MDTQTTSKINGYFLMARPYSLIEYPLMVLIAKVVSVGNLDFNLLDILNLISLLLFWAGLCWQLESEHKHSHRPKINRTVAYSALVLAAFIGVIVNPKTIIFSSVFYLSSYLYSKKEGINKFLNKTSFVFRGISQLSLFLFSLLFYVDVLNPFHFTMAITIGLMFASRNLLGDLRDINYDKKTFPKKYGELISRIITCILKFGAAILIFAIFNSPLATLPLLLESIISLIHKNNQNLHRVSDLGTSAIFANIIACILGYDELVFLINLLYFSGVFNLIYYTKVQRRSNKDYIEKT